MDNFEKKIGRVETKASKWYMLFVSFIAMLVLLIINFRIVPSMIELVKEMAPVNGEKIKSQISKVMTGFSIFAMLSNLLVWVMVSELEKRKKAIRETLEINPNDLAIQKEMEEIENEISDFLAKAETILVIVIGLIISWAILTVIIPLYGFVMMPYNQPLLFVT